MLRLQTIKSDLVDSPFLMAGAALALPIPAILSHAVGGVSIVPTLATCAEIVLLTMTLGRLRRHKAGRASLTAAGVAAIFAIAMDGPIYGAAVLAGTMVLGLFASRRASPSGPHAPTDQTRCEEPEPPSLFQRVAISSAAPRENVIRRSLDDLGRAYERLLLCERLVRGALTQTVAQMLWNVPDMIHEGWVHDASAAEWLLMGAAWLFITAVGAFAMWLIFAMLRGFFRGSLKFAAGWLIFSSIVIPWGMYGWYLDAAAKQVRDGTIWVFLFARLEPDSIFVFAAIAGWTLLRYPDLRRLRAGLPGRISVWQSCGVIRPARRRWRMVTDAPFMLSMAALILDGSAFYGFSEAAGFLKRTPDAFAAYIPAGAARIEAHYLYLTGLSLFVSPVLFLWMRGAFALAEKVRRLARRAAVLSAQRALELDARAPVLFLRSFADDHVSLASVAEPGLVTLFDPERERMDLEDLLQTCLSLGPLVAIGRPDDGRAPIGIPRAYVESDWRASVATFMDAASLVVLAISDSKGIAWELDQLSTPEHRGRAVIVTPPGHGRHYALLISTLSKLIGDTGQAARCLAEVAADHGCVVGLLPSEANDTTVLTTRGTPSRAHYDIVLLMALQRASVRRENVREKTVPRSEKVFATAN